MYGDGLQTDTHERQPICYYDPEGYELKSTEEKGEGSKTLH